MVSYFFVATFLVFLLIIVTTYYLMSANKAFLNLQQSAYDNMRFVRYIKSHFLTAFSLSDVLIVIVAALTVSSTFMYLVKLMAICFFMYYNLRFLNIANKRYVSKLKLNVTARVKRQITVYSIITTLIVIGLLFYLNPLVIMALMPLMIYPTLLITNTILLPIENKIKEGYKKRAVAKLNAHTDTFVIGITGSYGKTSIKNIAGDLLNQYERTLITPESYNTPMGLTITINNYLKFYHQNFIAEMGAYYKGEIKELSDLVSPKVGIVSSIGPQHLETFKTIETIQATKMELIEALPSDGLGILNLDNEYIKNYQIKNDVKCVYYSLVDKSADIYASEITYKNGLMHFNILYQGQEYPVSTKLLGRHNVYNILASILLLLYKGYPIEDIIKQVSHIKQIKNRLEYKYISDDLAILDDAFNANVDGIKEAINIVSTFEDKQKIIITPGLIDLGKITEEVHNQLGQIISRTCDKSYIIGNLNREAIIKNLNEEELVNFKFYDNFIDAYNDAVSQQGSKVILIANDLPDKFNE